MPLFTSVLTVVLALTAAPTVERASVADAVIEELILFRVPLAPCEAPHLVRRVAASIGAPSGIEPLPAQPCDPPPTRALNDEEISLQGMTAHDALDRIVHFDPRYRWVDADGVIVVRPIDAWKDKDHFLHRTVASFRIDGQNMIEAVAALHTALGPWPGHSDYAATTTDAAHRFSVALTATTMLDAFNAVVRAHQRLSWEISYCKRPVKYGHAELLFFSFDGQGIGWIGLDCVSGPKAEPPSDRNFQN